MLVEVVRDDVVEVPKQTPSVMFAAVSKLSADLPIVCNHRLILLETRHSVNSRAHAK